MIQMISCIMWYALNLQIWEPHNPSSLHFKYMSYCKLTYVYDAVAFYNLTLSWWRPLSYRNQSIDLRRKSMDWFLFDNGLHHGRVNCLISTMFMRAIWKQIARVSFWKFWNCQGKTRAISKFSKTMRVIYPKSRPNQICDYWLITPNQQTLCIETNIFFNSGQLYISERSITKQRVIIE